MSEKANFKVDRKNLEVTVTRVFDSPRDEVWSAYTDPKLIPEWWGPRFLKTTVDRMEFRPGGKWRFVHEDPEKKIYGFHGEYQEITKGSKIVSTFIYEGAPSSTVVDTTTFEELPEGKTKVIQISRFPSEDALDGMVNTGMESGSMESRDRLADLLERRLKRVAP